MTPATLLDVPLQPGVDAAEGGATLDDVIVGVWETLAADRVAPCPVCGGRLTARFGAGAARVAGSCRDCGSELD